jgi:hypothetical protein
LYSQSTGTTPLPIPIFSQIQTYPTPKFNITTILFVQPLEIIKGGDVANNIAELKGYGLSTPVDTRSMTCSRSLRTANGKIEFYRMKMGCLTEEIVDLNDLGEI